MRSMSDAFNRWAQQVVEHPHLGELFYRAIYDFESLEGADLLRFSAFMNQAFRNLEELYYLKAEGHLERRVWRGWEAAMRDFNAYPGVQAWWRSRSHWFSQEFANLIDQVHETAEAPKLYREANVDQ